MSEQTTQLQTLTDAELAELLKLPDWRQALRDASEERYKLLKEWESYAEECKAQNDMYGWNFHMGMAGGANWCDIVYMRVARALEAANPATVSALVSDYMRLRAGLPKTRDGVWITPGMLVWSFEDGGVVYAPVMLVAQYMVKLATYGVRHVSDCYSTRDAAVASQQEGAVQR